MTKPEAAEPRRRDGKAKFMALRETIGREVEEGHTLLSIYERHLDKSGISYSQFTRYVARFVRDDAKPDPQPDLPGLDAEAPAPETQPVERKPDPAPVERQPDRPAPARPASGMGARFEHRAQHDDPNDLI